MCQAVAKTFTKKGEKMQCVIDDKWIKHWQWEEWLRVGFLWRENFGCDLVVNELYINHFYPPQDPFEYFGFLSRFLKKRRFTFHQGPSTINSLCGRCHMKGVYQLEHGNKLGYFEWFEVSIYSFSCPRFTR